MNSEAIGIILFFICGIAFGLAGLLFILTQWARPVVKKERMSAIRHHVYEICVDLGNKVQDRIITPKEAELILRVSLVAVCRGNKKLTSYVHHVELEAMLDERD